MNAAERPDILTEDHLTYLDHLREEGVTNMYGASPYLVLEFGISRREAMTILMYWMDTFDKRHNERPAL